MIVVKFQHESNKQPFEASNGNLFPTLSPDQGVAFGESGVWGMAARRCDSQ